METIKFINICIDRILEYTNDTLGYNITKEDIYEVWNCKTLQNNKALLATTVADGMYYECTYNGDKKELYFDAYKKCTNICFGDIQ